MAASVKKGTVWKDGGGAKVTITKYTDKTMKRVKFNYASGRTGEMAVEKFKAAHKLVKEAPKKAPRAATKRVAKPVKAKARKKVKAA